MSALSDKDLPRWSKIKICTIFTRNMSPRRSLAPCAKPPKLRLINHILCPVTVVDPNRQRTSRPKNQHSGNQIYHIPRLHFHPQPQHVSSAHRVPQLIWHLVLGLCRKLDPSLSCCTVSGDPTSSGWRVAEWIPYAWKHSLMIFAIARKLDTDRSDMTTCTEARDFCWLRRQTWSSWIERTPGIYIIHYKLVYFFLLLKIVLCFSWGSCNASYYQPSQDHVAHLPGQHPSERFPGGWDRNVALYSSSTLAHVDDL